MSIAQGTTHYGYPQVQLTDRPTFADFNPAFNDIDAKLYGLITGASTDHAAIEALQTGLGETNTLLATVKNTADGAKSKADTNEENIGILTTALSNTNRTVATKLDSVAIADPYDPDAGTYNVGDVVVYNGQRYRCTTAVAVAEPFDADKWTGEDVQTVIDGIKSDLTNLTETNSTGLPAVRVDNAIFVNVEIANGTATAGTTLGTVQEGFRPSTNKVFTRAYVNDGSNVTSTFTIKPDGTLVCSANLVNANATFYLVYTIS